MTDFYSSVILDHGKNPKNVGEISQAKYSAVELNVFCGDVIKVDLEIKNGVVSNLKYRTSGCLLTQASASILSEKVIGKRISEVENISSEDIIKMIGFTLTPTRVKCAVLPLLAVKKALKINDKD